MFGHLSPDKQAIITDDDWGFTISFFLSYRPLIQNKLEVLSKVGLSRNDFKDADTKVVRVSVFPS